MIKALSGAKLLAWAGGALVTMILALGVINGLKGIGKEEVYREIRENNRALAETTRDMNRATAKRDAVTKAAHDAVDKRWPR